MTVQAYVPLYYAPGEAYQFNWSHEIVVLTGVTTTVKVAHIRLCHSRMMYGSNSGPDERAYSGCYRHSERAPERYTKRSLRNIRSTRLCSNRSKDIEKS